MQQSGSVGLAWATNLQIDKVSPRETRGCQRSDEPRGSGGSSVKDPMSLGGLEVLLGFMVSLQMGISFQGTHCEVV